MRVVSLIASATEMVCALGGESLLVGRSHECDFPPSVRALPALTEPKFAIEGTSADVDRRVRQLVEQALSVYRVFPEQLDAVRPDLIITQAHCKVCAVSLDDVTAAVAQLVHSRPRVLALEPNSLDDVWEDLRRLAEAIGREREHAELERRLWARMGGVIDFVAGLPDKPHVAVIEWIAPLMAAGNWMPTLVAMAGGENLFGAAGQHSPEMRFEALVTANPEVIVVTPCGFDIARTRAEMAALTSRPEWARLRAVQRRRVYLADGNQYFNRPGPRLIESLEILAELFHPDAIDFGHQGSGWEPL